MRNDFVKQTLIEMRENSDIVFLTADLGFNALEPLKREFPDRFYNVGIAEANMVGMACGLAHEGKKVVCYSIASFAAIRAYEQIRLDVCYDNLDIKIIGAGGGFNYAAHGVTHHTIEDIAALSALPNMRVANPAYSFEAREVTKAIFQVHGPCYVRLGKNPGYTFNSPDSLSLGQAYFAKTGTEILLLASGNLLDRAMTISSILETRLKKSVGLISVPWIKPLDLSYISEKTQHTSGVFTLEEHNVIGGLGSFIGRHLAENALNKPFEAFGIQDVFHKEVGTREYLLDVAGLSVDHIVHRIEAKLKLQMH